MQKKSKCTVLDFNWMFNEFHTEKGKQLARLENNLSSQKLTRGSVFSSLTLCENQTVHNIDYFKKHFIQEFKSGNGTQQKIESSQLCQKSFMKDCHTKQNKKSHSKVKTHECKFCNRMFTHSDNLQRHMRIHTGGKTHLYPACEKSFAYSSSLETHTRIYRRIHAGEKSYQCLVCQKRFS